MGGGFNTSKQASNNSSSSYGTAGSQGTSGLSPGEIAAAYRNYLPSTLTSLGNANAQQLGTGGAGANAATAGSALQRQLNPEYYGAIGSAGRGAAAGVDAGARAMNAVNLNGLSPGEYNAVERGTNQYNTGTGNSGLANPTNAISNAMNFGGAFNNKVGVLGNAIGANSGAVNAASGVGAAASPNTSGFNAANTALGSTGFGASYINPISSVSQQSSNASNSSQGNGWSSGNSFGMTGPSCCFIFLESYHGKIPDSVRRVRDKYYRATPVIAKGYKRMAKWLVPLMQRSNTIRWLVWNTMVKPATRHCENVRECRNISRFWLRTWALYGRI